MEAFDFAGGKKIAMWPAGRRLESPDIEVTSESIQMFEINTPCIKKKIIFISHKGYIDLQWNSPVSYPLLQFLEAF